MRSDVTGRSLSYGFMKFVHVSIAKQVIKEMNGVTIGGRPIRYEDFKILINTQ